MSVSVSLSLSLYLYSFFFFFLNFERGSVALVPHNFFFYTHLESARIYSERATATYIPLAYREGKITSRILTTSTAAVYPRGWAAPLFKPAFLLVLLFFFFLNYSCGEG